MQEGVHGASFRVFEDHVAAIAAMQVTLPTAINHYKTHEKAA